MPINYQDGVLYRYNADTKTFEERSFDWPDEVWQLANRTYSIVMLPQELESGRIIYVAYHPEIQGCMTQGDTAEQALLMLEDARLTMIDHLLRHNLKVPDPDLDKYVIWDEDKISLINRFFEKRKQVHDVKVTWKGDKE